MLGYTFNYWAAPFYQWYLNMLVIPAGVMLDPIYNPNRPKVFNYGILGPQIAAELFEGVGEKGGFIHDDMVVGDIIVVKC